MKEGESDKKRGREFSGPFYSINKFGLGDAKPCSAVTKSLRHRYYYIDIDTTSNSGVE